MPDFTLARRAMVDSQLRPQGVTDPAVLAAMGRVAREEFVPASFRAAAYVDRAIPLEGGRALMPPAALGRLLSEAAPRAGERALVLDAASPYAAVVLEAIGLDVTSRDGVAGKGDFDLVLVDGAIEQVPAGLGRLVRPGGRIAAALVDRGVSRLAIGTLAGGVLSWRTVGDADVAPIPAYRRAHAFAF